MDTLLHGKIGQILGKELIDKGYNVSKKHFVYGNLLPDLSPKYRFSMHTKKGSFNDTLKLITNVIYERKLSKKDISIKLGMITHYLCDFFTFPHNEGFNKTIIHHEFYEQTQRMMFWYKLKDIWSKYDEETRVYISSIKDLIAYIEDMHSIYLNNKSNRERDILYSAILVRVVTSSILSVRGMNIMVNYIEEIECKVS